MPVDLRKESLHDLLTLIAEHGAPGQTSGSKTLDNFKLAVQLRIAEEVANELKAAREEGGRASNRLFWLNVVLALATAAMGLHAAIMIYQIASGT